jgi:hypothetical protein
MCLVLEINNTEEEQAFRHMDSVYIHDKNVLEFRTGCAAYRGPSLIQVNLSLGLGKTDKRWFFPLYVYQTNER